TRNEAAEALATLPVQRRDFQKLIDLPCMGDEVIHIPQMMMILSQSRVDPRSECRVARTRPGECMAANLGLSLLIPPLARVARIVGFSKPQRHGRSESAALTVPGNGHFEAVSALV